MARRPRISVAGETQHVIQRGNNRTAIFFDDLDRQLCLAWLGEARSVAQLDPTARRSRK
jgi:putative transposase